MKCAHSPAKLSAAAVLLSLTLGWAPLQAQAPGGGTSPAGVNPNEAALRRVSDRLKCQCGGCTASVHTCPHQMDCGLRMYIRNTIQTGLAAGKAEDVIVSEIVQEYGPQILLEPPRQGFTLLGWVMPFVALLAGAGAVGLVLWRWKRGLGEEDTPGEIQAPKAAPPQPIEAQIVEKYRGQIDRELERD